MKHTFTQTALATALMIGLSQAAYANGINSPAGINVEIGAGGTSNILTITPSGQVGIDNPAPAAGYALDVNGKANIDGNLDVSGTIKTSGQGVDILLYGVSPSTAFWSGKEAVLTLANGEGTDADGIWIGPNVTSLNTGTIGLFAKTIYIGGNVGIGTETPHSSLDLSAKTDAISLPQGTSAEAPPAPTRGMTRYNTDINALEYWNGSAWTAVASRSSCVMIYGTNANTTKTSCGFVSSVSCPSGYSATVGGSTNAGNVSLQNSKMILDGGVGTGWQITVFDNPPGGGCALNDVPNGTKASGTPPDLSFTDGTNTMSGDSYVVCCP